MIQICSLLAKVDQLSSLNI
uniref:Uncharacterized protein n=1 Tax=Arundo donax TaxID=35708 RepID=A0A0A8Y3D9_ARUDO